MPSGSALRTLHEGNIHVVSVLGRYGNEVISLPSAVAALDGPGLGEGDGAGPDAEEAEEDGDRT